MPFASSARAARLAGAAVGAVLLGALCACSGSSSGRPTSSNPPPSAPSTGAPSAPTSSSAAPSSSAQASDAAAGPAEGGVDYLHLYQALFDTRRPLFNDLNQAGTDKQVAACVSALRKVRDAESTFNLAVRKVAVPASVAPDVNTMLADSNALIAIYDSADGSQTFDQFKTTYIKSFPAAKQLGEDEIKVGSELGVMSDHPTEHLNPSNAPQVIKPYQAHLFGTDGNASVNAGYKSGIYRMRIEQQSGAIFEDVTQPVHLANTTVDADVYLLGKATTAYVSCRSSGVGTRSGTGYYFGITSDGSWYIQRIDSDAQQVVYLASGNSSAIHTGTNAHNSFLADCAGHYLTLFANSMPVFQVYDDALSSGNVGIGASVFPGPGEVLIGNFTASGTAG